MRILQLLVASGLALGVGAAAQSSDRRLDVAGLRDCAKRSLATQRQTASRDELAAQFLTARATMAQQAAAIEAERATIDRNDPLQIAAFNRRAARACADYADLVVAYNASILPGNSEAVAFNTDCADRDYSPAMVASLPADLRAAWRTVTGSGLETAMLSSRAMR